MRTGLACFAKKGPAALLATALFASCAAALPALANGGDFFAELAANWSADDPDSGVPYFGFIKDTKGKFLPTVTVSATAPNGSAFVVLSDALGHYKIPGFSKSINAKLVQVTCMKVGYKLVTRDRRVMMSAPNAPIETDCVLTPDGTKAAS